MMKSTALTLVFALAPFGIAGVTEAAPSGVGAAAGIKGLPVYFRPSGSVSRPYKSFAPYELAFGLPKSIEPNMPYRSVPFYAVVLKVAPKGAEQDCDGGEFSIAWENERKRVQKSFPQRKVFADHQCPDMGAVSYTIDGKFNTRPFIAIYGGATRKEAEVVRSKIKKSYRAASIKRISVSYEQIMQ
jgi:hypothetical protein